MDKLKASLKYLRLSLFFAFVVFLILLCTMGLVFFGIQLLAHGGVLDAAEFRKVPLFAFCIASILVGTVIAAVFSKKPLRPLREMMNATDKIAAGDYSVRLQPYQRHVELIAHCEQTIQECETINSHCRGGDVG